MTNTDNSTLELSEFVPYRMVKLASNMSLALSKMIQQEFAINIAQWRVIAQLGEKNCLHAKDVGAITAMNKSKVSRAVKTLKVRGVLDQRPDKNDNRAALLSLTPAGIKLYQQIVPKALDWEKHLVQALNQQEQKTLMHLLNKLDQQTERLGF